MKSKTCGEFLACVLAERKRRNPRYSMRTFAKKIGVSHSYLSDLLLEKRTLTLKRAEAIVSKLDLDPAEEYLFMDLVRGGRHVRGFRDRLSMSNLSGPKTKVFSNWFNVVLLELGNLPGVRLNAAYAARVTGVSERECARAIKGLADLGALETRGDDSFRRVHRVALRSDTDDSIVDGYTEQLLAIVRDSLKKVPASERAIGSRIFSMSSSQFRVLQERLFALLQEIMLEGKSMTSVDEYDSIYLVFGQVIPLVSFKQDKKA